MSRYIYGPSDPGRQVYDGCKVVPENHEPTWETETGAAIPTSTTDFVRSVLTDGNRVIAEMVDAANWSRRGEVRRRLLREYLEDRRTLKADLDGVRIGPNGEQNPAGCGIRKVDAIHRTDEGVALVKVKKELDATTLETAIGQAVHSSPS
jgi:hypothetical protein